MSLSFDDQLARLVERLAALLGDLPAENAPRVIARVADELARKVHEARAAATSPPLPPELLEWARRQHTEDEVAAGIREIRETGGLALDDFYPDLDEAAGPYE